MASRTNFLQDPSIFKDCPVQIIAGSQKTIYYIHPGVLLSSGSPVLKTRVSDHETIDWTEFDEDTVECALSYLYVKDYDVQGQPIFGEKLLEDKENDNNSGQAINKPEAGFSASDSAITEEQQLERPLTPLSRCLQAGLPLETMQTAAGSFTKMSHACDGHLGNIALMHAKIYCFAHQFLFSRLETLALQRLTQLLLKCDTPTDPFFLHLADAIRLIYDSTIRSKMEDPARELLSQYVALNYTKLSEESSKESLGNLIAEGGDFTIDVTRKLARRISMSGTSIQSLEEHIDGLEMNFLRLKQGAQEQSCLLRHAEEEIREWESWNRGISAKHKKAKRVVTPFDFSVFHESSA
ncbi:hypothetical protein N7532_001996 [Penicillium argentinense]|uniref:BTB domain-containing protein n=1 Tax=Penicillium argentinense TaxID=1131581 RepID=A0A9W9G3I8_9EURO|nr:uncharacterized protein N7532_001996 [Penicillium argentinense]KAJ5111461.1 hypothetical protein N7532_001996 [Penicillium argentinense]